MNLLIAYNSRFKTIIIKISNKQRTSIVENEDMTLIYSGSELIGINVLNVELDNKISRKELEMIALDKISHVLDVQQINKEPQFIVVEVIECEKIPDTHLSLCQVKTGKEIIQIVCGASNVKAGMKTILAKVGSWMPNGLFIEQGKLRGHDSFGMLCSAKELNLDKFNEKGIIELSRFTKIGKSLWEL
ncbi:tRNA-binding protein [Spiroplasma sp. TIUS-1]|uniref:YtpR family tRNA-binding protein n=1 Tax=Spiroplasma sp. TIUS-1 TaxID=216963 RepID=UPI0013976F22|nr:hypothetical protein [Spiroplasma sp. TIUS-1]QHX36112.1 tRNA-binding protein [Spiroplasma sp. TIUS-1]